MKNAQIEIKLYNSHKKGYKTEQKVVKTSIYARENLDRRTNNVCLHLF